MKRRTFLALSGSLIAASSLYSYSDLLNNRSLKADSKRPNPADFSPPILKAIAYGLSASNPHNTQAWKFKILSDTEALLYIDKTRILPTTDPYLRQIHIGCGCFLETAKIGMTQESFDTHIEHFPEVNNSLSTNGEVPVAKILFLKNDTVVVSNLAQNILKRKTSRKTYSNKIITPPAWSEILNLIGNTNGKLELITETNRLNILRPLLADGMEIESYTFRTHEESRKWFREKDEKISSKRDGINLPGNGVTGAKKWIAEFQLKGLKKEDWHSKKTIEYTLASHRKRVETSPNIISLKTSFNTPVDWLKAGHDYSKLQLACLLKGFYIHPLSQVLQEFEEMSALKVKFEKEMNVQENEKIQMVARAGESKMPYLSYRRKINDYIRKS